MNPLNIMIFSIKYAPCPHTRDDFPHPGGPEISKLDASSERYFVQMFFHSSLTIV